MDETADGFFSPRYSPLRFLPLWDARSIIPSEGAGETADPEEDIVNDDEYADERDPH